MRQSFFRMPRSGAAAGKREASSAANSGRASSSSTSLSDIEASNGASQRFGRCMSCGALVPICLPPDLLVRFRLVYLLVRVPGRKHSLHLRAHILVLERVSDLARV